VFCFLPIIEVVKAGAGFFTTGLDLALSAPLFRLVSWESSILNLSLSSSDFFSQGYFSLTPKFLYSCTISLMISVCFTLGLSILYYFCLCEKYMIRAEQGFFTLEYSILASLSSTIFLNSVGLSSFWGIEEATGCWWALGIF
jgi:hypothetical protein